MHAVHIHTCRQTLIHIWWKLTNPVENHKTQIHLQTATRGMDSRKHLFLKKLLSFRALLWAGGTYWLQVSSRCLWVVWCFYFHFPFWWNCSWAEKMPGASLLVITQHLWLRGERQPNHARKHSVMVLWFQKCNQVHYPHSLAVCAWSLILVSVFPKEQDGEKWVA